MTLHSTLALALALGLPLAAAAQQPLEELHPPVYYQAGTRRVPLYAGLDTLRQPQRQLPAQSLVTVVGQWSPRWVLVRHEGFLYLAPAAALLDYDPADASVPPLDAQTHRIAYEGVVQVPGATQAELLARARAWVARAYDQHNATITRDDPATGEIDLQGTQLAHFLQAYQGVLRSTYAGVVHHSLRIYAKDGRYKYVLTDLVHDAQQAASLRSGGPLEQHKASLHGYAGLGSTQSWTELKTEALRNARHLVEGLEAAMTLQAPRRTRDPRDF